MRRFLLELPIMEKILSVQSLVDAYPIVSVKWANRLIVASAMNYADVPPDGFESVAGKTWRELPGIHRASVDYSATPEFAPITDELFWIAREESRLRFDHNSGPRNTPAYTVPAWLGKLPDARRRELWFHYVHLSMEKSGDRGFIAYTPNHEYGKRDRQVRISVGRYLSKFYAGHLSEERIREIVNSCKPLRLMWGRTQDDFEAAYTAVSSSCMGGESDCWEVHPSRPYGGSGDFEIAVLVPVEANEGDFTQALARAVVFKRENFVRVYGDEGTLLSEMLRADGLEYGGGYEGGRLADIRYRHGDRVVMPYIDGDTPHVTFDGKWWVCGESGEFYARSTGGYIELEERVRCDSCHDDYCSDDITYSDHTGESYCYHCRDSGAVVYANLQGDSDWIRSGDAVSHNGEYYEDTEETLAYHDLARCHSSGEICAVEDMVRDWQDNLIDLHSAHVFVAGVDSDGEKVYSCLSDLSSSQTLLHCLRMPDGNVMVARLYQPGCVPDAVQADVSQCDLLAGQAVMLCTVADLVRHPDSTPDFKFVLADSSEFDDDEHSEGGDRILRRLNWSLDAVRSDLFEQRRRDELVLKQAQAQRDWIERRRAAIVTAPAWPYGTLFVPSASLRVRESEYIPYGADRDAFRVDLTFGEAELRELYEAWRHANPLSEGASMAFDDRLVDAFIAR